MAEQKILVTGNMGYVGPVLVRHLRHVFPGAELVGFDDGLFAHCLTAHVVPERLLDRQLFGDVRDIGQAELEGFTGVVALAAISNDPMGARFAAQTDAINRRAVVDLAHKAAAAGVGHFVFASSCSVYGSADSKARTETSELNPLTAYARSKIDTEQALTEAAFPGMAATALRFATACGMSERLRLDLVLNDFVACAVATGAISILSDGTPWRPLIDVKDMARAIEWALTRPAAPSLGPCPAVNVGRDDWNFQVEDLAEAVTRQVEGARYSINPSASPDRRSYRVDFGLYRELAPRHQPTSSLDQTIHELHEGLRAIDFADADFRNSSLMRLKVIERHIGNGWLSEDIRWRR